MFSLALGTIRINFESLNVEPDNFIQSDYMPSQPRGKKIDPRLLQHVPLTKGVSIITSDFLQGNF